MSTGVLEVSENELRATKKENHFIFAGREESLQKRVSLHQPDKTESLGGSRCHGDYHPTLLQRLRNGEVRFLATP